MPSVDEALYRDLPDDVRHALESPPLTEKMLLELAASWPGAEAELAWTAERLRLFLVTWDPFEHTPGRPKAVVVVNTDPDEDNLELVVYLPLWAVLDKARAKDAPVAHVLAEAAAVAVATTTARRRQTDSVAASLALGAATAGTMGRPVFRMVTEGWDTIGLGAITDFAQHAYGVVDLDRSPVRLKPATRPSPGCPACAGESFGFIAGLMDAKAQMCSVHSADADEVARLRLGRAHSSNPEGWAAIVDASVRLSLPHLPNGLAGRLADVAGARNGGPAAPDLAECGRLVVEAAAWFPGRPHDFAVALGADPKRARRLPSWLGTLVADLDRAGLHDDAQRLREALVSVDPSAGAPHEPRAQRNQPVRRGRSQRRRHR